MLHEAVELLLGVLIFVLLPAYSDSQLSRYVPNALVPDKPVEAGINAHVLIDMREFGLTFVNISD